MKILFIAACNRIHRLIRIGHGIEEGVQRPLRQFIKRVLRLILSRTAKHGMFQNMRRATVIFRRRFEYHIKNLIVIRIFQI